MRLKRSKLPPLDLEHMRLLHEESIDQLEMMSTVLEAACNATDSARDALDRIAINHWDAYLDIIHLICMHDDNMNGALKKQELSARDTPEEEVDRQFNASRLLLISLLFGLIRRHRRFIHFYGYRSNPMNEYLQQSMVMEREHIATLIAITEETMQF